MGFFDSIFGIDSARNNIRQAGKKAQGSLQTAYDDTAGMYQPYREGGNAAYGDLLTLSGVGGPGSATMAWDQYRQSPMFQSGLNEGIGAIDRSAAGRSGLNNGNVLRDLSRFATNYNAKNFGDYYNRIAGIANQGYDATGRVAAARGNLGQGQANIQQNVGNQLANADLASGGFLQSLIGSGIGAAGYAAGRFGGYGVPSSAPSDNYLRANNQGPYDPRRGGSWY